jgi:threonine/homoserine/homoserine lactone efflux protein
MSASTQGGLSSAAAAKAEPNVRFRPKADICFVPQSTTRIHRVDLARRHHLIASQLVEDADLPDFHVVLLFSGAALLLAVMPGPGLFYVVGRTLLAGRADGLASCSGTMLGGLVHVAAGALGVSAILMASAAAFSALKFCGGLYLIYLGVQSWRSAAKPVAQVDMIASQSAHRAFRQAIVVEATNPKTAVFFLALIPQFVNPLQGHVAVQFIVLGFISVILNTAADVVAVIAASSLRDKVGVEGALVRRIRKSSALMLGGIGVYFLFARREA